MVIHNFHFVRTRLPAEANAPLVVDTDAVLSNPTAFQQFQPVAWRHSQVEQLCRGIQQQQFSPGSPLDVTGQPARYYAPEYLLGLRTCEAFNHLDKTITPDGNTVKR
jgi:hypothetical protein